MIVVKLMGGIGNQMFQYAAARSLSISKKTKLYLDHSFLGQEASGNYTYRRYELSAVDIHTVFASSTQLIPFYLVRKYHSLQSIIPYQYFNEPHFEYISELSSLKKNIYLDGYWQSENYFIENEQQIREDFQFTQPLTDKNKAYAEQIKNCNAVAVHIRRGDYVSNQQINSRHGTCSLAYYQNAITFLKNKFEHLSFFFFSDDPQWAIENFESLENSFFISHNKNENSFCDMHLMSLCNHFIIANSSFSWWGAWLSEYKEKVVIAPSKWFTTNEHNTKDLIPENWIKL